MPMQNGLYGDAASNGPSCGPGCVKGSGRPQDLRQVPHIYCVTCKSSCLPPKTPQVLRRCRTEAPPSPFLNYLSRMWIS
ncbi:Hypothetical protein FKW44_023502 [Caligus rogercresseyi]|uniref:Uncharacterized protein n=1 Tax=Caligus rogercresseyi TaxID=217165 RepID=A0A7T8JUT2_CALRO|nr:Hypothetical protein FKW44_023502 [Caligus rogercresseyi]